MATEAETKEPISETVGINDGVNMKGNFFEDTNLQHEKIVGEKLENERHPTGNGANSEELSEVKVETETEAAEKHAMDINEKITAEKTEAHTAEKENKSHDETVTDKLEEEKMESKNGNLKDENLNYSISGTKQSEKENTNGPTEINTSDILKRETTEQEDENLEKVIEGKEAEIQAGDIKIHEVESLSIAQPTEVEQKPDTNVLECQEFEDDNQNKDDENGKEGDVSNINIGISESPQVLQETPDHEDVSRTKDEREFDETINYQGTTDENVQTEKTDVDNQELDVEAVKFDNEKEMSEDNVVLVEDQLKNDICATEIAKVNNVENSSETSRVNLDGDVGENDRQLESEGKFESFDVHEIAKEEEETVPNEETKESILEPSSTTMGETSVKEDEENIDESKNTPTPTKTTQVEYVQENGINSPFDDQTSASISLSDGHNQDEQKDKQDESTNFKLGNEMQTEPKLYETNDTSDTSGANSFKDKGSMERNAENSLENQLQQNVPDVFLDSLSAELQIETEGETPNKETVKEGTSKASTGSPSIFAVEGSQDQGEEINAMDTKAGDIDLTTLDENLSSEKALQEMNVRDDHEYKEEKLETILPKEELEDKSIKKETGAGAEQEFYEASETMETFKESVAREKNEEKEISDDPHFHENVTEAEDTRVNEMEKEGLKAEEDKESDDENLKDSISNISENLNLHESPALITDEMDGADLQIADDLIKKPEKEEPFNVTVVKDIDGPLVVEKEIMGASKVTSVKAGTASENECKEKHEIKASSGNKELEVEQQEIENIIQTKQESFNTRNTDERKENEGLQDKESGEENISEKEILEYIEHEKSPHVVLENLKAITATKDIQDIESENQGQNNNEDNAKKIEASVHSNTEAIPGNSTLQEETEHLANQLPEKDEATNITTEEDYKEEAVTAEDDHLQEQMIEKTEEKDDMYEEVEPNIGIKTTDEGKGDGSIEETNITENIIKEELCVHAMLEEEQKEEQHIENEMLAEMTTYKSCDVSESSANESNIEKETEDDDMLAFEQINESENIPEVTIVTDNIIKEKEDVHALQEEEQNEALHIENEMLVENTTYESCGASESNENESIKEKERSDKDTISPEGPEITTEAENIHESETMDTHTNNEDNLQSTEDVISETEIASDNQNTNSIQTTDSKLSEKARETELAPQINTMDATNVSLDKEMQNDFEAVEEKIHSKVDVMNVSENNEENKAVHSSLQNKELEHETHTEQELYQASKSSETNENEIFEHNENTKNNDSEEDKLEGKEPDTSSHVSFENFDALAETKDCNHIKPNKQETVTIHEANFDEREENVIVEESKLKQLVNHCEDTLKEENVTPEHLSHQMADKEATNSPDQETSAEIKSSNEKQIEETDLSEYEKEDKIDNLNEIETKKQDAQIDDEHNLQEGEDVKLVKSTTETEPDNEITDSTHPIDRETQIEKITKEDSFDACPEALSKTKNEPIEAQIVKAKTTNDKDEEVNDVGIASFEKNTQIDAEVIEDVVQNSSVELEISENNDQEKEEVNIISQNKEDVNITSQNKEEVIKPLETANDRKREQEYNEINNEGDTQKGEDTHTELAVGLDPAIQSSNSATENEEGQVIHEVGAEELMIAHIDTEILHDKASQKISLDVEEKVSSANTLVNAISENENKDSNTKENEGEIDLKGLDVANGTKNIRESGTENQDAADNDENLEVELDAKNHENKSIHNALEAIITSGEVKDVHLLSQEDTQTVQVEGKIRCTQEENNKVLADLEKDNKENKDNSASLRKEELDENTREELDGNLRDRIEENEQLQTEQICFESCSSSNANDNENFPEKLSVSEEELKDQKPENISILVPEDLNATPESAIEKETTEVNDEKHVQKEDTMLAESAIVEESGKGSNAFVCGTDGASTFDEAKADELSSQIDLEMTHANALNGNENPLHENIENDNRVFHEKILSEAGEGHENKSSIERDLIVVESAKIATASEEKDQDEEHIEENKMIKRNMNNDKMQGPRLQNESLGLEIDDKMEQSESTIKMGVENTEINTALSKDDKIEIVNTKLLNEDKAELDTDDVPVDRVKENNDQLTKQNNMLSDDTEMETDDSFSKISNYWPINHNEEVLNVNKMETVKLDEKTESSQQLVRDKDLLQEQSLQEPEQNQSDQVIETEQLIDAKASSEVENDNIQEENLPFSQFLMKHILMNESDSLKTSYDEERVETKNDNDKQDDIDISKLDEKLAPSSVVEKIHHASIADESAGFHENLQENNEVQVYDRCDVNDSSEAIDNKKDLFTTELPISVVEKTQSTSIVEDKTTNKKPQENNEFQADDNCDVKDNSEVIDNELETFTMEFPTSVTGQTQCTSIVEEKAIEKPQESNEIQVDDKCDVKDNSEFADDKKENFTTQLPISIIGNAQRTSIAEDKAYNEKPQENNEIPVDNKCDVIDASEVVDDRNEFSTMELPIAVDASTMEHEFDSEEDTQNEVDTLKQEDLLIPMSKVQKNGKPKDDAVPEKLPNSYDPVQAEKSYGVASDSETNFVKNKDKEENISKTLSEKSIPAIKDEEDVELISTDTEIKEENPNLVMEEQISEKSLDDTIAEKKILHKKDRNELKSENSENIEEEKQEQMLKNGLKDEITVAGLQKDQQTNPVVEPEAALEENYLERNQDMHKYEKENGKEQKKFEAPALSSEDKVNSEIKPVENVENNQDILNQKSDSTEELRLSESQKAQEVDDNNTDDAEDENREVDEHKGDGSNHDETINVESRDTDVTPTKKKSHGLLSGVGSKVKRSIIKVKKAITGKSSHSETQSPK